MFRFCLVTMVTLSSIPLLNSTALADLQVGAAIVNISPNEFPVIVNGNMTASSGQKIKTPVNARAIVISDGTESIAMVVVDSCMIPTMLLDDAKHRAAKRSKLKPDHIMISATHTHTAPSSMGLLGSDVDLAYVPLLREGIVEAIVAAESNLQPARVGWGTAQAPEFTALRRWIRRPDRVDTDPFGNPTIRANMHAGRNPDDVTGESGPEDPQLSLIAFESHAGVPIAVLSNFSMHYFGDSPISADYFGLFANGLQDYIKTKHPDAKNVVAAMSHGCSGDIWRRDYTQTDHSAYSTIESYTEGLLKIATETFDTIEFENADSIAMAESRLHLPYRVPDQQRLEWGQRIVESMEGRMPKTITEVYAREQVLLHELQSTDVVVQAIRIGEIAIATTPNETYALSGLKLKRQSPLEKTMVIELANGADGYIPPPEQHPLGGYNTFAARSAGLEAQAEPKIIAAGMRLLEEVSGKARRPHMQPQGPACTAMLEAAPLGYWRLDEMEAPVARDISGHQRDGIYEPGVVFFLAGPHSSAFTNDMDPNRSAHFAGGRMRSRISGLKDGYSVSMWFWNGMPVEARETAGWLFSRDHAHSITSAGEHLGVAGVGDHQGRLMFQQGTGNEPVFGTTPIERWTWNHLVLVREGSKVRVYLNGNEEAELQSDSLANLAGGVDSIFFGGRSDNDSNWEGRLDEIAIFDRALTADEMKPIAAK
ncbi:Neutral/alkaline non-lysosomal ceramidase [Novipirellula galeiformis]|uniref:Neutral/alkaline non-lysosomal ceramidase n=1 Tax=Novipirellula galeiformis TaxID=2528004 RepID=A0A5C6CDH0_9BACT|nr:neutral/alkaline non-lysosomal ceramidase N-terminal domain-containing protein [Novipirellula galeiformis]TWU21471.1 Neutral/alkaline non-lysosomal ceramidase [Novipirellula galeiformis]